jgi:effector-binding domain-containing protein
VRQQPMIEQRAALPYAGIRMQFPMDGFPAAVDAAFPELFGWLADRGIQPAGPPFIRYHAIDMPARLDVEFGIPLAAAAQGDDRVRPGVLPAGRYVTLRHTGPYDGLIASNAALQDWAEARDITFDSRDTDHGEAWHSRVEHYLTDPSAEPDPAKWQVDIAYLVSAAERG